MFLTESQFQALKNWIQHEAYVAAGSATHQSRCKDTTTEWLARGELTGNYEFPPEES